MKLYEMLIVGFVFLLIGVGVIYAMSFWTHANLDFWVDYARGYDYPTPRWISVVGSVMLPLAFVFNLATEIIVLFI